jgi:hypothetical protein
VPAAIYAGELHRATEEGRIKSVPYDRAQPVHTFWDLGHADATAIRFAQAIGFEFRLIDYDANRGQPLAHYLGELQKRGYVYGEDWLPHDAKSVTLGTGKSIEDLMRAAGRRVRITRSCRSPTASTARGRSSTGAGLIRFAAPMASRRSATTATTRTPAVSSGRRRCTLGFRRRGRLPLLRRRHARARPHETAEDPGPRLRRELDGLKPQGRPPPRARHRDRASSK